MEEEEEGDFECMGIGNYYGSLQLQERGDQYFWGIENWDGTIWEEIPKSLYYEIKEFEQNKE